MRGLKKKLILSLFSVALTITFGVASSLAWVNFEPAQDGNFVVDGDPQLHITEVGGDPIEVWEARLRPSARTYTQSYTSTDYSLIKNDPLISKKSIELTNTFNKSMAIQLELKDAVFTQDIRDVVTFCLSDEEGMIIPPTTFYRLERDGGKIYAELANAEVRQLNLYVWLNGVSPGCNDSIMGAKITASFVFTAKEVL